VSTKRIGDNRFGAKGWVVASALTVTCIVQDWRVPRPDRQEIAAIAAGGAVGALARVALARGYTAGPASWPWVTFAVNLAGAFLLGYFATRLQERLPLSAYRRPLLGTGFCGALTTFSTMQLELVHMLDNGSYGLAVAYAATSLVAGYACVHLATAVVRRVRVVA
jgi:fluoride exporter